MTAILGVHRLAKQHVYIGLKGFLRVNSLGNTAPPHVTISVLMKKKQRFGKRQYLHQSAFVVACQP